MEHSVQCAIVLLFTSGMTVLGQEYTDIPVSYVTPELVRPAAKSVEVWNGSFCANVAKKYQGYTVLVEFNLPENLEWNPLLGVVYGTVSNGTSKSPIFCQNYDSTAAMSSCHYTYDVAMGSNIFITVTAGDSSHIQYSLGVSFVKSSAQLPLVKKARFSPEETKKMHEILSLPVKTAADVAYLVPIVHLNETGVVATLGTVLYTFNICPLPTIGTGFSFEVLIIGLQPNDAFTTYACKALPCTADNGNVIKADISDSSINVLPITWNDIAPDGDVYLTIFGFGGKKTNEFSLGAVVQSK